MKKYEVISDFIDKETGDLIEAGSVFDADEERADQLRAAGVIGKEVKESKSSKSKDATEENKDEGDR
jgi:hypothetical protein